MTESPTSAPHFAKVRDYPPFAHPSEIVIAGRWRPILRLNCGWQPGVNHRRQAVFIGANPSAASGVTSDATINKVLRFMCSPGADLLGWPACNELLVVNLSPIRATLAHEAIAALSEPGALAESMERNEHAMEALRSALSEGVYQPSIFVGWGDCLKHHTPALAAPFVELLRGREVLHLPPVRSGAPGHPCRADLKTLRRSVLWPKITNPRCTLCGDALASPIHPAQHLECWALARRLGIPCDDRAGWESALVAASEDDIRRALDGYRILPTLERRQRLITSCTNEDIPF